MPFSHCCVHILIHQLLFHIGDEEWKTDLQDSWRGLTLLASEMTRRVPLLRESPKDADELLVFGVISSFLGQFNKECLSCARDFSSIAHSWADNICNNSLLSSTSRTPDTIHKQSTAGFRQSLTAFEVIQDTQRGASSDGRE